MDILNSDDSNIDSNYIPDEDLLGCYLSSGEDESTPKRRKKEKRKVYAELLPVSDNCLQIEKSPETSNANKRLKVIEDTCLNVVNNISQGEFKNTSENSQNVMKDSEDVLLTKRGTARKRGLKGESRNVRSERKEMRNTGQAYKTRKGKTVEARKSQPLGPCRNKCFEKVTENICKKLFQEYWQMNDFNRRCNYLASLLQLEEPKRRRVRTENDNSHFRQISIQYNIEFEGHKISICKGCFVKLFGESRKMIENVVQKKRASPCGIIQRDERGSFTKTVIPQEDLTKAQEFLMSIPAYDSHYSRRDCGKKFVAPHLTITALHEEYKQSLGENLMPISYRKFSDIFHSLQLKIKKPKVDTCSKCDKIALQIKFSSNEEKDGYTKQLKDHHEDADYAYVSKKMIKNCLKLMLKLQQ